MIAKTQKGRTDWLVEHLGKGSDSRSRLMPVMPTREDRTALQRIMGPCRREVWTRTCGEAIDAFRGTSPPIVICDRELRDGDWRELWDILARDPMPPMFIVTSRLADDALWAEVLNIGGYDLLLKPFRAEEVIRIAHGATTKIPPAMANRHQAFEILCRAE